MNKYVLAGVSAFALTFASGVFAQEAEKVEKKETVVVEEASTAKAECPPKKKKHAKKKYRKQVKKGDHALWVNAEAPCAVPCAVPCGVPTCPDPKCNPAPTCEPAPAPVCPPPPPAPVCPPPAPVCDPVPAPVCEPLPVTCVPQQFASNPSCPYLYHGGYFYYPHAQATRLVGYKPTYIGGAYWYASHMHPYHVYVERRPVLYVMPHSLTKPQAMQKLKAAAAK